tara:strand:- start:670 stop:1116 length:447 start_codon:yes stop_codon:yes gene_type:complete
LEANFKKIKSDIDFKQNINKLIDDAVFLAAQINVKEIKSGIDRSTGPKGKKFKKLAPSTIKQKRKKGQPLKPLIATGMMRKLPPVKGKKGKTTISVAKQRVEIGGYHDQGGKQAGRPPQREWFDIYKTALPKIEKMLKSKLIKLYSRL